MRPHGASPDDHAAMALCAAGHKEGFEALYARQAAACRSYAGLILRDGHHAEDVVQEAYLDLWRTADRYDVRRSSVRSWLLMPTHRRAVDRLRAERRRATCPLAPGDDWPDPAPTPDTQAISALLEQQVHQALAGLPLSKLEALVLAYWGGYTQREIAALTGSPVGTVKSRMHDAMRELNAGLSRIVLGDPRHDGCPD